MWNIGERDATKSATLSFSGSVTSVSVRPDGEQFAVGGSSQGGGAVIKLWALEGLKSNATPQQTLTLSKTGSITCLTFTGDSRTLMAGEKGGGIRRWDAEEEGEERKFALAGSVWQHEGSVTSVAVNGDGKLLASSGGGEQPIRLWDLESGQMLERPFDGHRDAVTGLAFASNGEVLLSGGRDGMIKRWTVADGKELESDVGGQQAPLGVVAISPDGRTLASGGRDGRIDLWDLSSGVRSARCGSLEGHPDGVSRLAFSRTGETLVSAGEDGAIR